MTQSEEAKDPLLLSSTSISFYPQYLVTILYYRRSVGDEDNRLVVRCQNIMKKLSLGIRVERTGSLVKKHNAAIAKKTPGNSDALRLPLAQSSTLLTAKRTQSLWKFQH